MWDVLDQNEMDGINLSGLIHEKGLILVEADLLSITPHTTAADLGFKKSM
jgi:hypothetical protein